MNLNVFRRIVESFFRRWPLYVALFAGVVAFGASTLIRTEATYTSSGTIFVDSQSLVTTQSGIQSGGGFSYLSPAQFTSQELNGLLQTDAFMESVLNRAAVTLDSDPTEREDQVRRLRAGMGSYASSQNLVKVNVTSPDPDLSYELTAATIAEFVQFQIGLDVAESGASEEFFSDLAQMYEQDLESARQAVDSALLGVNDDSELTPAQELQIQRLQDAETLAETRYRSAADDIEVSRLAKLQTETDIRQSYSAFDPPQRPTKADGDLLQSVPLLLVVVGAGAALALAWPIASGFTDRTIYFGEDLNEDTAVLGLIPRISKRSIRLKYVNRSEPGEEEEVDPELMLGSIYERAAKTRTFIPPASSGRSSEGGVRSDSQETLAQSQTNGGLIDEESDSDGSSDLITLGGPVDDPDPAGAVSEAQRSLADDDHDPVVDADAGHQTEAYDEQAMPAESEPADREDERDGPDPEQLRASTLMSWASHEEDDHEAGDPFVVVDSHNPSPDSEGDPTEADPDGSLDGGESEFSPRYDPSVTTELQIPPDIPVMSRRDDDQEADERHSGGDEPVTARSHHA